MDKLTTELENRREFTFILNPITTSLSLPYEVIPDWFLRRASEEEGRRIYDFAFAGGLRHMRFFDYGQMNGSKGRSSPVPETWKLYVLEHKALHEKNQLEFAANLLKNDLALGPSFGWISDSGGHRANTVGFGNFGKIAQFLDDPHGHKSPVQITEQLIVELREIEKRICRLPYDQLKPHRELEVLRSIPHTSPLFTLGLFAIIESLLAHDPHDQFDSLRHQVSSKMVLLSKRFSRSLPYDRFGCSPETLWKKLYDYRSCIAHGSEAQFGAGNLNALQSARTADEFLKEALKLILLQTLLEPELINDLKAC